MAKLTDDRLILDDGDVIMVVDEIVGATASSWQAAMYGALEDDIKVKFGEAAPLVEWQLDEQSFQAIQREMNERLFLCQQCGVWTEQYEEAKRERGTCKECTGEDEAFGGDEDDEGSTL